MRTGGSQSCIGGAPNAKHSKLLAPANETAKKAINEYDTEEEKFEKRNAAYNEAVKKIRLKPGDIYH